MPTPPANNFLSKSQLGQPEEKFPLDVFFCNSCTHLQLLDVVDPEILFRNYVYISGTSPVFVEHFRQYAEKVSQAYDLKAGSRVVEIGSNDGTLLRFFQKKAMHVLGIDPARQIAADATAKGIETLPIFFNQKEAAKIKAERGAADLIVANNVFAHIDDLQSVANGVRELLQPNGVFVFEVSYLVDVFEKNLFDTIYHEHLDYHSVKPLVAFFERSGMELIDVERVDSHGGSLRGFAKLKDGKWPRSAAVGEFIAYEEKLGLGKVETFGRFAENIKNLGIELRARTKSLRAEGKRIAGFGAPAKATTLMHHFGIGADMVDFIVDDSPLKQGLYSPGLHVPVKPSQALYDEKPDYVIVLAWNFADSIIAKHKKFIEQGGHFIVPLPKLKEV